mmetsp:Transcript_42678/g.100124  ORF Transcript_42678/g.100124 Transcript_42678/m.100124 type:complete len:252 (+) Transcript_42678:1937-2692(+)
MPNYEQILEEEFSVWCRIYTIRTQCKNELIQKEKKLAEDKNSAHLKKKKLQKFSEDVGKHIPHAMVAFLGPTAAMEMATVTSEWKSSSTLRDPTLQEKIAIWNNKLKVRDALTPAQQVRNLFRRAGGASDDDEVLTPLEQQWCYLDSILRPEHWKWMRGEGDDVALNWAREAMDACRTAVAEDVARRSARSVSSSSASFHLNKSYLQHILASPTRHLSRRGKTCKCTVWNTHFPSVFDVSVFLSYIIRRSP